MARFQGIPNLPTEGMSTAQLVTMNALRQNVLLLTGAGGEGDSQSKAVLKGDISIGNIPAQTTRVPRATGAAFIVENVTVASGEDHANLRNDVQGVANDVATLYALFSTLVNQLKGSS